MPPESRPTNANLHKWSKRPSASYPLCQGYQSLFHILNDCPKAMSLRRYTSHRDSVLHDIISFDRHHLLPSYAMSADHPECAYAFPQHITPTNLRPDEV